MKIAIHNYKGIKEWMLSTLLLSMCFQNIKLYSFGDANLKLYHIYILILFAFMIAKGKILLPPSKIMLFFLLILLVTILQAPIWGISSLIVNYAVVFLILLLTINLGYGLELDEWTKIIKDTMMLFMLAIWIKNIAQIEVFLKFFSNPYGHPEVSTFIGGGVNIEATFIAMMIPFFVNDRRLWPYQLLSLTLSAAYVSRAAILTNALVLLWMWILYIKKRKWIQIAVGILLLLLGCMIAYRSRKVDYLINRLANIGKDSGSFGRLRMWNYVWDTFIQNPLGYGIGNSIEAIKNMSRLEYIENNLHNVYMQMFIDLGIIGGGYYCILIADFLIKNLKRIKWNPVLMYLSIYVIISTIQFRGTEVLIYYILGIYLQQRKRERRNKKNEAI